MIRIRLHARSLVFRGALSGALFCAASVVAHLHVEEVAPTNGSVRLEWSGGLGPFAIETSRNLDVWTAQADPTTNRFLDLSAFHHLGYYRVRELNPSNTVAAPFGFIQTEQSEFGSIMGMHRLKTRLWLYRSSGGPHQAPSYTAAEYWKKLWAVYQFHEDGIVYTWSGELSTLGTVTSTGQQLKISWARGSGDARRDYALSMQFPYSISSSRTAQPRPSDPRYSLTCNYAIGQPEFTFGDSAPKFTKIDKVALIQVAPSNPSMEFLKRKYTVSKSGIVVNLHFYEGMPLVEGSPPFILKTFPFDRWLAATTVRGGKIPTFSTDSNFSRTAMPGHHNFYEIVLVEPALDPAISQATLDALKVANIRLLYTFKDLAGVVIGGDSEDVRYIGFDNTVRTP